VVVILGSLWSACSFSVSHHHYHHYHHYALSSRRRSSTSGLFARKQIEIPILDLLESDEEAIQPLPSDHLPDECTTLNIYGMQIARPVHQMIIDDAAQRRVNIEDRPVYGQIAYKPNPDSLVGAIGCTAEILLLLNNDDAALDSVVEKMTPEPGQAAPQTVLCRGFYRFIVRDVIKTIPFPVAIVDELEDDDSSFPVAAASPDNEEDDDDSFYDDLTPDELVQKTILAMKEYAKEQVEAQPKEKTLLEEAILEDSNISPNNNAESVAAEEMAAVLYVFLSSLADICPMPQDRYFAIAFLAAEMANMDNSVRRKCLTMTNSIERLRFVLERLDDTLGMARAGKMAETITDVSDESEKDLQVGNPTLPPWAKQIRKGMRVEYFWNEDFGWCEGVVVDDPVLIVDELLIKVYFPEDDETHVLPFSADDKIRWRPPQQG
jgi:hypothetical protein